MAAKKAEAKFTIQFNRANPNHSKVAEIINNLERFCKAQYIVDAVLYYEGRDKTAEKRRAALVDEKSIEDAVSRVLSQMNINAVDVGCIGNTDAAQIERHPLDEIKFDDTLDAISEEGLDAIAGALDMFRSM